MIYTLLSKIFWDLSQTFVGNRQEKIYFLYIYVVWRITKIHHDQLGGGDGWGKRELDTNHIRCRHLTPSVTTFINHGCKDVTLENRANINTDEKRWIITVQYTKATINFDFFQFLFIFLNVLLWSAKHAAK